MMSDDVKEALRETAGLVLLLVGTTLLFVLGGVGFGLIT